MAEATFAAGATRPCSLGDQALFLDQEEITMKWFLLPSDCVATATTHTSPFQPRVYPHPSPAESAETSTICKDGISLLSSAECVDEGSTGCADMGTGPVEVVLEQEQERVLLNKVKGQQKTVKKEARAVHFHSPPKQIFRPTVEVCVSVPHSGGVCECAPQWRCV